MAISYAVVLLAIAGYVMVKGGSAGRANIIALSIAFAATQYLYQNSPSYAVFLVRLFPVDVALLIAQLTVVAMSRRTWCAWVAAFQLNAVTAEAAIISSEAYRVPFAYMLTTIWALPTALVIGIGVWRDNKAGIVRDGQGNPSNII